MNLADTDPRIRLPDHLIGGHAVLPAHHYDMTFRRIFLVSVFVGAFAYLISFSNFHNPFCARRATPRWS